MKTKVVKLDGPSIMLDMSKRATVLAKARSPYSEVSVAKFMDHFSLQVEGPARIAQELAELFSDDPHFYLKEAKDFPGVFDWASGTYIKDCSVVWFYLRP